MRERWVSERERRLEKFVQRGYRIEFFSLNDVSVLPNDTTYSENSIRRTGIQQTYTVYSNLSTDTLTDLFNFDIQGTGTYEENELYNPVTRDLEESWLDNRPTYSSDVDGFYNGGELPEMVRVGSMTYFQNHKWYDELVDGKLKDETLAFKAKVKESWGNATLGVIKFYTWLINSFGSFHELDYNVLLKLQECWWKINACQPQNNKSNKGIQAVDATDDSPAVPEHKTVETPMNMSSENKDLFLTEKEAIHLILTGIRDEIYSTVDACQIAQEIWEAIERFYKLMNEMIQNNLTVTTMQVNVKFLQQLQPEWSRFVKIVKQQHKLDEVSYHKLFDILKQYQNKVNELCAEILARNANPLALVATAQADQDPYYQTSRSHKSHAPSSKPLIPTGSHTTTRHKGKEIAKPITPPSEITFKEDSDPKQAQRDKDMQKNLALIVKYFKKIYKPTNNNLGTSSNSRNKNVDTTPRYKNDDHSRQFGNQRTVNVAGAREKVGSPVVQQYGIQCFNCKEFEHFAKQCIKPKRVKDSAYHKENMLLYKQAEQGVPLQAEHYMEKIQEVPIANSGTDSEPLEHVQNDAGYIVFANDLQHSEQSKSVSNTCLVETDNSNVIPDSPDMCEDDIQNGQNDVKSDDEHVALANLIANLKFDVYENKKIQNKSLRESISVRDSCLVALQTNQTEFEKYKTFNDRTIDYDKLEHVLAELQCMYLHKVKECDCLAQKLLKQTESVSKRTKKPTVVPKSCIEFHKSETTELLQGAIVQLILFIVDSGCTKHMTGNLKLLCNFVEKFLGTVHFSNDQFAPILGYGDLGNDLLTGNHGSNLYTISLKESTSTTPLCLMAKATPTQAWLWHRRLSHLNFDYINLLLKKDIVIGLPKLKYFKDQLCSSCELSKAKKSSFKTKAVPSSKGRLNLLHIDLYSLIRVASINGKKYILVIVDDYSIYIWTLFLHSKDETPEVLKEFLTMIQRNLQALVITVRTDRGTKFLNKTLNSFFKEEGIEHQTSTTRTPKQNGVVERQNHTLVEAARTMLSALKLPLFFWAAAIATACYTQNRSIIIPTHGKTPYHIINDKKPSIKHLYIFCCICYITRDGKNLDKIKEKGDPCILVRIMLKTIKNQSKPGNIGHKIESLHQKPNHRAFFYKDQANEAKCQKIESSRAILANSPKSNSKEKGN
nr:hypothetical protein [Tanacetum cinerariifolium]